MRAPSIIVIGASEGGITAIRALLSALPGDLPAAVFVVLHIGAHESDLAKILDRDGPLPAIQAKGGEPIRAGRVYVAPPDHHMIVSRDAVLLTKGPRENFARPSIDPLFRSAAAAWGPRAIGVILTGGLNDGTAGLYEIKAHQGVTIVQDPADATNPSMARSALKHVACDHCVPLALMPQLLERVVAERLDASVQTALESHDPSERLEIDMTAEFTLDRPVAITCPDCGGALRESQLGTLTQFRCHIGHVYTAEVVVAGQFRAMQQSLEAALRAVSERLELCRQMAAQSESQGKAAWGHALGEAGEQAERLRELLNREWVHPPLPTTSTFEKP